jgi:isoleucyl-tRNA synthetase
MKKKKIKYTEQKNFSFIDNEKETLDWWYKQGVVEKYLNRNENSEKNFSFIDGPITANNPMGVHHAWGRTLKDLYQRYKNMQGFKQRFQNGFDCQGLWVEVEVEKEKGFKNKSDIEKFGIDKFVQACKDRVLKYSDIQTKQSQRLGYFMDWDNSYFTMSEENNYMIWHFLKACHEEGNIYQGTDSVPWCPRCGTSISQHEIATEGYKVITHDAVFMKFPVIKKGKAVQNEYLLVWTTTPWTIPADTLVAVHPEVTYVLVKDNNDKLWLAKDLVKKVVGARAKILKEVSGKELIEKEKVTHYQAPFDDLPIIKDVAKSPHFHQLVFAKDLVTQDEGTGLVHIVPGAGTEDHHLVKNDLKWNEIIFPVVGEDGSYLEGYGFLTNKNAKKEPELVIDYLKEKENGKYLYRVEPHTHSYPVCWRCSTELIWRIVDEWYISMDNKRKKDGKSLRQRMIEVTKTINWIPDFGLKRELDWLNNMHDWLISKKRYWGLALPIWKCEKCGSFQVIGSKKELEQKAVEGWDEFEGHTPHKPWIDKVKIKCNKCGGTASRIPDVGNPWLDAGIVPFSTLVDPKSGKVSYLTEKKQYWKKWYPADFITECFPGQFRNWFYSLIAMGTALEDKRPFKNILGHASVRDEKGREMHKSSGNAIWFDDAAEKMGADTLRWLYVRQNPELNLNLGYKLANEVRRQYIFLYWNSFKFFQTYAIANNWSPTNTDVPRSDFVLDKWIVSRMETTKNKVEKTLENYSHQESISYIENFLEDLSLWYIRRSRDRLSPQNENEKDRQFCFETLNYVLNQLTLVLAPIIPFLTETVWQNLHGNGNKYDPDNSVHLQNWPKVNKTHINKNLEKQMELAREAVTLGHSQRQTNQIKVRQPLAKITIKNISIDKKLESLIKDELNVKQVEIVEGKGELEVNLDTTITPQLKAEGEARDLIRQVQIERRNMGLKLTDKIRIKAKNWPKKIEKDILQKTGAISIEKAENLSVEKQ